MAQFRGFQLSGLIFCSLLLIGNKGYAANNVLLMSGTFDGEHPGPVLVGKVARGDRLEIEIGKVTALVNYPDRDQPLIAERVSTFETGATVSCPWYVKLDGSPQGARVNLPHSAVIDHKAVCVDGGCKDALGRAILQTDLLFGQYNLPKCKRSDGSDFGFADAYLDPNAPGNSAGVVSICCQEFTVERRFTELHYFDQILILDQFREQELTDLDVDFRKIYLTFENEKHDRATCQFTDLLVYGNAIQVGDLKDCVLPSGDHFTLSAQSRFFLKDTRPCGKFVARGVRSGDDIVPDWFLGWYECDGKADRIPIEKQFTYSTRLELKFTDSNSGE